tara:strand:+ start:5 stop:157 length:153 start_codon:yes stop_codon:yes gene_type:complete
LHNSIATEEKSTQITWNPLFEYKQAISPEPHPKSRILSPIDDFFKIQLNT